MSAHQVRLRRIDTNSPGITRRRHDKGFSYRNPEGSKIADKEELERLRGLAIPPAWREVWICPHPGGHIQATGFDDAGREQYIYHPRWQEKQASKKFDHVLDVGDALPGARRKVSRLLRGAGDDFELTCAIAFRLLDRSGVRVGNEEYAETNDSYGLTTMLVNHVRREGDELCLEFPAKSGQRVNTRIRDAGVAEAMRPLLKRPKSDNALAYRRDHSWHNLSSGELNDFLREVSGIEMTAKDFRTWQATVLAARALARHDPVELSTKRDRQHAIHAAVEEVSEHLQNTPTIARNSYIDPRVIERFEKGAVLKTRTYRQAERGLREFLTA